jgi:hypothetical protein
VTTTQTTEWATDQYNDNQGAQVGELALLVIAPPWGTLHKYPHQWQVQGFRSDRNIAGILAHGEADTLEAAQQLAVAAAERIGAVR